MKGLFKPRYKRYAAWPIVIFCRLLSHTTEWFWSGTICRCAVCGDKIMTADKIKRPPLHVQEGWAEHWCRWFAWYPVPIGMQWTWLRFVECRYFHAAPWFVIDGWWEFRRIAP